MAACGSWQSKAYISCGCFSKTMRDAAYPAATCTSVVDAWVVNTDVHRRDTDVTKKRMQAAGGE